MNAFQQIIAEAKAFYWDFNFPILIAALIIGFPYVLHRNKFAWRATFSEFMRQFASLHSSHWFSFSVHVFNWGIRFCVLYYLNIRWSIFGNVFDKDVTPMTAKSGWGWDLLFSFLIFFTNEFIWYFGHVILHKVPLFWAFHRIHHAPTRINYFTRNCAHFSEGIYFSLFLATSFALVNWLFLYFGVSPNVMKVAGYYVLFLPLLMLNGLHHTEIPMSFGTWDRIIASPAFHQIHHSYKPEHIDRNYGSQISLFDWLFGTYHQPVPGEERKFGLGENEIDEDLENYRFLKIYFVSPFSHLARRYYHKGSLGAFIQRHWRRL